MPAKNPRINVVLEEPLYKSIRRAAKRDGVSISTKVRDLVREAVEANEDLVLAEIASKREERFDWDRSLSHEGVFGSTPRKKKE